MSHLLKNLTIHFNFNYFDMAITKVWIEDGCTACAMCEDICPNVFEMPDLAEVKEGADFAAYEDDIKEAADSCPVEVIKFEE